MLSALLASALVLGKIDPRPPGPALAGPAAPHVPVVTPTDKPKGDLPPRIEPKPLPPV